MCKDSVSKWGHIYRLEFWYIFWGHNSVHNSPFWIFLTLCWIVKKLVLKENNRFSWLVWVSLPAFRITGFDLNLGKWQNQSCKAVTLRRSHVLHALAVCQPVFPNFTHALPLIPLPRGHLAIFRKIFGLSQLRETDNISAICASDMRPRMLLSVLWCTGLPSPLTKGLSSL